jgi:S-methylmethionine-dependent homocysteine/selenocysteine methylase
MSQRYEKFMNEIRDSRLKILDSGVSTELERRGGVMDEGCWSARVSIDAFDLLVNTHKAYIDAGADIITVNSFATSRLVLGRTGNADQIQNINMKNIEAALEARVQCGADNVLVAGSIAHQVAWERDGETFKQQIDMPVSHEELKRAFNEMIFYHEQGEVDVILLEMMTIPNRMKVLFDCLSSSSLPIWCGFSAKRENEYSSIASWHDRNVRFIDNILMAAAYNFDMMGIMHSSVDLISDAVSLIQENYSGPLMAYPDSGYFKPPNWQFEEVISPEELSKFALGWKHKGVAVIGGCCGLGPEHTKALAKLN